MNKRDGRYVRRHECEQEDAPKRTRCRTLGECPFKCRRADRKEATGVEERWSQLESTCGRAQSHVRGRKRSANLGDENVQRPKLGEGRLGK